MDVSVAFMMFTCKYSYLAFSYTDGEIEKIPNFSEYLGFIYFYSASVIGPTFNFINYHNFINLKGQYANLPSRLRSTLQELGYGILFALLTTTFASRFPLEELTSEEYGRRNFLMKMLYLHIYTFVFRFKYYSGIYQQILIQFSIFNAIFNIIFNTIFNTHCNTIQYLLIQDGNSHRLESTHQE